ncbi:ATPase component BioM of energizing module of biotin ECF transporter [hydrothermal vent metagenome]|uniref:ATPase component BioM of energizing module of biotin ECF transporter n=1 Tax=hydrothermal vent metagenome TaxID=652676 RepID=A0A1W1C7U9_9ZZZZ
MIEILFRKQEYIYRKIEKIKYKRYFFDRVDFSENLIGLIGARGIGKTTFLLQYLQSLSIEDEKKLYFSVDSIVTSNMKLFDIAEDFYNIGGKVLVIDEIHKYRDFEIELKEIYDFLDLKVIFSGSSAIILEHKKADLSRRAMIYRLKGLSFREFLELKLEKKFSTFSLDELLNGHIKIAKEINKAIKPLEHFKEYLKFGYYPFYFETKHSYCIKLEETINTVIESDLPIIFNIEPSNIHKLKQLVAYICSSKPYELNITALAQKIGINRKTLYQYIYYLTLGNIFNRIEAKGKGDTLFSKPAKLYLNNPNLNNCYCQESEIGTIREEFFFNMLSLEHKLLYPKKGDFLVNEKYIFEIGGKNKSFSQIKKIPNSYVVADNIEMGFGNKIPLWLFGFLY